jgi:hypothetical protein
MLAAIRLGAGLRSLEAASFDPRMVRRIATGAMCKSTGASNVGDEMRQKVPTSIDDIARLGF